MLGMGQAAVKDGAAKALSSLNRGSKAYLGKRYGDAHGFALITRTITVTHERGFVSWPIQGQQMRYLLSSGVCVELPSSATKTCNRSRKPTAASHISVLYSSIDF